ncbi:MAG: hypothetical protein IJE97_09365 [Thermoguttaceae bacterium]|nr:hypothetical protein [Thermoguttaceae bacterium]
MKLEKLEKNDEGEERFSDAARSGRVGATVGGVAGAVLFSVGVIAIAIEGAPLYTGRIGASRTSATLFARILF